MRNHFAIASHWITAALMLCLPALGIAKDTATPEDAYAALGTARGASPEELDQALEKALTKKSPTADHGRAITAYSLLSSPELRRAHDSGARNAEIELTPETQKILATMAGPLVPAWAASAKKISVDLASNMATFYMTMAGLEAWNCHRTQDPTPCTAYVKRLSDPAEEVGFALFVLTSQAIHRGLENRGMPKTGQYGGLAAGFLVNELFSELWHMAEVQEYRKTSSIADPEERKKKRDELLAKIYAKTFGNPEWRKEKVPAVGTLLAAAAASTATTAALQTAAQKFTTAQASATGTGCAAAYGALAKIAGVLTPGTPKAGVHGFLQRRGHEVLGLLLFMGWDHLLHAPVATAWDKVTLERDLEASREQLKKEMSSEELNQALDTNSKLWNSFRRKKLSSSEALMAIHSENLAEFDQTVARTADLYQWFVRGFQKETQPKDSEEQISKHLRSFFCGVDPKKAFKDSDSVAGLPVPGKFSATVTGYRVAAPSDPALCNRPASDEKFRELLGKGDYHLAVKVANAQVKADAEKARAAKVKLYESKISEAVVQKLRDEVLPAFSTQLTELRSLERAQETESEPIQERIRRETAQVEEAHQAAKDLLKYYQTNPGQRLSPEQDLFSLLPDLLDRGEKPEWKKAVQYYKGYILR